MAALGCSKCKVDEPDHRLMGCRKEWPQWEEQVCDRCLQVHDHTFSRCKKPQLILTCKHCGHEGSHNDPQCPIKDRNNPDHVKQWTKVKYQEAMAAEAEKQKAKMTVKASTSQNKGLHQSFPSHPSSRSPGAKIGDGTTTASGSRQGGGQGELPRPTKPSFRKVPRQLPPLTHEQVQKQAWAQSNLKLADFSTSQTPKTLTAASNFFKINMVKDVMIRKYRIVLGKAGDRDITKREVKRDIIESILRDAPPTASAWVCDYFSHIISVGKLYSGMPDDKNLAWGCIHQRPGPNGTLINMDSTFFYEGSLKWDKLSQYIDPRVPRDENYLPEEDFLILNMLSWKHIYDVSKPAGNIRIVGKKFYPESRSREMNDVALKSRYGDKVAIIRKGFFTSVRPGNGSLYLNVNTATTAFYPDDNLHVYIKKRSRMLFGTLAHELKGLRVVFRGDSPTKTRSIFRITLDTSGQKSFSIEGEDRTVYNHMQQKYGIPASELDEHALCIVVGQMKDKTDVIYPADTLKIVEWQAFKGKMDGIMTKGMLENALRSPKENGDLIVGEARIPLGILDRPRSRANKFYSVFGLSVNEDFTRVGYHALSAPRIQFKANVAPGFFDLDIYGLSRTCAEDNGEKPRNGKPARDSASWNLKEISTTPGRSYLQVPPPGKQFLMVGFLPSDAGQESERTQMSQMGKFATNFARQLRDYGLQLNLRAKKQISIPEGINLVTRRSNLCSSLWGSLTEKPDFMIFVLPDTSAEVYSNIRWWTDCLAGVHSMCISSEMLSTGAQNDRGLFGNLSLKVNYRLGGVNHCLSQQLSVRARTMIVGADVTHPGRVVDTSCPSMAGVVATYDTNYMTYLASARLQKKNTEHISDLKGMMAERLRTYQQKNAQQLPSHILFYRDGVSESQFGEVREKELPQIIEAWQEVAGNAPRALITLVIVGKRHHTRFYPVPSSWQNIKSGLVVDETIVAPKQFNFYLQAHDSPIGTARNAHYVVLENESGYNADDLQLITNNLSFTASKATKGLSVCAPARYADTLCDRLRRYMRPALESDRGETYLNRELNSYKQDAAIWHAPQAATLKPPIAERTNPWRPELNDTMFYL